MKTVDAVEAAAAAAEAAAAAAASGLVAAEGSKTDEAPSADSPIADTATAGFVLDVVAFPAARVQGVGALSACLEKSRSRRERTRRPRGPLSPRKFPAKAEDWVLPVPSVAIPGCDR